MPTSLFQYEMLPTTWFYLSSLLILAVFFRFNRLFCLRNWDVFVLLSTTPGLVYVAMGSALQGYLWLYSVGALLFIRLAFDAFLRRRPILEPNLTFSGLAFSSVAASAFMIPNLFLNRGDACESPRAWRLEQILAAAEESDQEIGDVRNLPGYLPFLRVAQRADRFFAPSQESWKRAVADLAARKGEEQFVEFFGLRIRVYHTSRDSKRPAAKAMRWASGAGNENAYDLDSRWASQEDFPESLNGVKVAESIPTAPIAPTLGSGTTTARESQPTANDARSDAPKDEGERRLVARGSGDADSVGFHWTPLTPGALTLVLSVVVLQLGVVISIILIGKIHFGALQTGFGAALLYLLLPYINQFSARLDHIVPAYLILTAVLAYRRPFVAGVALGVAGALVFYPFFLIPLWLAFYWKKGAGRFVIGTSAAILTTAALLLALIEPGDSYAEALAAEFGRHSMVLAEAEGLWEYLPKFYRIPIIALYGAVCFGYAIWIPRKNLATLISCTAALMLGAQFWMGRQGGLYMAWYLPLVVLTTLRPNLADRTAVTTVVDV